MSKIFDNITEKFESGLHAILTNVGVKRADFCVGYFNLRGWRQVADDVDKLPGCDVVEMNASGAPTTVKRISRLLIGMHHPEAELIQEMYALEKDDIDGEMAKQWIKRVAGSFRRQLTYGIPTAEDENTLKKLRQQLVDGKVCVKLHLRYPLHAKLYLAHRPQDTSNPIMSIMGSSNLTFSGMMRNGELNAEFGDFHDNQKYAKWFNDKWNEHYSVDITTTTCECRL